MSKSGMISTYNSNDDKFYDDITDIIKRVSNRTLEMKTNNVKLLNKIAFEMNNLLSKTQDIVNICLNDRSGSSKFFIINQYFLINTLYNYLKTLLTKLIKFSSILLN